MKIRIEMTAEELGKANDLCVEMFPEYKEFIPSEKQQVEISCNIASIEYNADSETGFVCEYEMKTHFILWMLRKTKPFISAIKSLWHMFTDFFENIELMAGDITFIHNGVNINEALSNITDELDYELNDEAEHEDPEQFSTPVYTIHYNGKSEAEISEHIRFFFDTDEQAKEFIAADTTSMAPINGVYISDYSDIFVLYCYRSPGEDMKNIIENCKCFKYRGLIIQKSDGVYSIIDDDLRTCSRADNINDALAYIDAKLDCNRTIWRVYSTADKSASRIFENDDKARDFFSYAKQHSLDPILNHFEVPIDFDFSHPSECTIKYRDYMMTVDNSGMTYVIDNKDMKVQYINIFDAMDYIDECHKQQISV